MTSPRTILSALALTAAVGAPAAAAATGTPAQHLPTLKAPATAPASIHGETPKAVVKAGDRLTKGQSLLRVRVNGPAKKGTALRLTCASGFVTGYGYKGADALAVNGHPLTGRHSLTVKVQAAADRNKDGRFTGIVFALCEAGH